MRIDNCTNCQGTGNVSHAMANVTVNCFTCNGYGKSKNGGYGAYKSQAMADRHGKRCYSCKGTGKFTYPTLDNCRYCNKGKVANDAHIGDILPAEIGSCDRIPKEIVAQLINEWKFVVVRNKQGLSWGESFLGLGSIYTSTDYGRAWNDTDDNLIEKVKESLREDYLQWTKVIHKFNRQIVGVIGIKLTPNGYSVTTMASRTDNPILPPTYTPELLNRPI